jgi:glycosyltransferase involved in cell wall biosynthesis
MRVLLSAYACIPGAGSEYGFGWGWAEHLAARGIDVHLLTASENREALEGELRKHPRANLTFSLVPSTFKRARPWNGLHYLGWHYAAFCHAQRLHAEKPFDLIHHVTFGSAHVPPALALMKIPMIFGPVGGGQTAPVRMLGYFGRSKWKEIPRSAYTALLPFSPIHHWLYRQMSLVLATNHETVALARKLGSRRTLLSLDTGLPESFYAEQPRRFSRNTGPLRLLWTGRIMPRKALALTLDGLAAAKTPVKLTVIGDGLSPEVAHRMTEERGLTGRVVWTGRLPWSDVRKAYGVHDAFLFTSLRDSFGSQHLEAMAAGLPVLTLDIHGAHALIPCGAGIKIPVSDKPSTIAAIGAAIDRFASCSVEERNRMSRIGWEMARSNSWAARAEAAEYLYRELIDQSKDADDRACFSTALSRNPSQGTGSI